MSASFTPGPWEVHGETRNGLAVRSEGRCTARLDWNIADEVDEANARLIASSPKLYQLSEAALEWFDRNQCATGLAEAIREALAEVRGEQ